MSTTPPPLPASLQGPIDTLLIDNFDSFTYNLYQQLLNLPSPYTPTSITVIRNNLLHPSHLPLLDPPPKRLIISPGPGNPDNEEDVGISIEAIKYFAGKIPVLGVCMGLECIVSCFGGRIAYAGEIMHGKVSHITHDARGLFKDIPQNFKSVRYHSLSAQTSNIPEELAICATTQESGVIMALRHRVYTVESVQYHPESFMSEGGDTLLCNFMSLKGGTWAMNPHLGVLDPSLPEFKPEKGKVDKGKETILQKIYTRTSHDVNTLSSTPGSTLASLKSALSLGLAPPLISFVDRLKAGVVPLPSHSVSHSPVRSRERDPTQNNNNNDEKPKTRNTYTYTPALLAEIKRASPSKGLINPSISAPHQALSYALAGASVISVLTEPHWFKGSKEDLLQTRLALSSLPYPTRPAVLRKDFILSPYQIYEARLWGADTVLLIVAMLPEETLVELVGVSRSLGMEPLIEVNSEKEMTLALSPLINAKVIGINNRNLHTFEVDMETTSRLASLALDQDQEKGEEVIVCALSGIEKRADVEPFLACGVKGILVGESLMRAKDVKAHVRSLLGLDIGIIGVGGGTGVSSPVPVLPTKEEGREGEEDEIPLELEQEPPEPLVKICGVRSVEDALMAAREGADMVGVIFVEGSMRCITLERARQISLALRSLGSVSNEVERVHRRSLSGVVAVGEGEGEMWFSRWAEGVRRGVRGGGRPLLVGVFQNAPISEITHFARVCMLDMVQLHGEEPVEVARWLSGVGVGVIRVLSVDKEEGGWKEEAMRTPGYHHHVLLDSPGGGTGEIFDWSYARRIVDAGELIAPFPPSETDAPPNTPKPTTEHPMPIILAGGLTPSNVRRAVEQVRPWCVDVSGGVEVGEKGSPKDAGKVRAFVRGAKGLDLDLGEMGVEMMGSGEDEDST